MPGRNTTRRDFLGTLALGAGAVAFSEAAHARRKEDTPQKQPNILLILSDEHNARVMGCAGNHLARTPSLDRLAAGGVVFENGYCNSPLCVPSRLSITSGKYISRVGAWNNDCWLPSDDYPSLPRLLNGAGYDSVLCGKMHYDSTRRYGFREIGGNMNRGTKTGRGGHRDPDDLAPAPGTSDRFNQFHAGESSSVMSHDLAVTKPVVDFLKDRKAKDKPFFLTVGYIAPHFPLIVPETYWKHFEGRIPMPVIPEGYLETLPRNYKHLRIGFHVENVPENMVRKGRELYYGLTEWVDAQIGQVLDALDAAGLADDTLVVYSTDHGENMGEHGLWWKNNLLDSASHVPLIARWPNRWKGGQRRAGVCSLVDVVQTLAETAGTHAPDDWDGDSLFAYLDDPNAAWKDRAIGEYYGHNVCSGSAMIRLGRWKYIYHARPDAEHDPEHELYDLAEDPGELRNLAALPEHKDRIAEMHTALIGELGEEPDVTEQRFRAQAAKGYGRKDEPKAKPKRFKKKPNK